MLPTPNSTHPHPTKPTSPAQIYPALPHLNLTRTSLESWALNLT
jgi:hypothetical protein